MPIPEPDAPANNPRAAIEPLPPVGPVQQHAAEAARYEPHTVAVKRIVYVGEMVLISGITAIATLALRMTDTCLRYFSLYGGTDTASLWNTPASALAAGISGQLIGQNTYRLLNSHSDLAKVIFFLKFGISAYLVSKAFADATWTTTQLLTPIGILSMLVPIGIIFKHCPNQPAKALTTASIICHSSVAVSYLFSSCFPESRWTMLSLGAAASLSYAFRCMDGPRQMAFGFTAPITVPVH